MKIFRKGYIVNIVYIIFLLSVLAGCGKISVGMQRRKFEFLYKMNNYAALLRGFTNDLVYYKDLDFYEARMKQYYEDVNRMETIDGYGTSRVIKEKFLETIDTNVNTAETVRNKNFSPDYDIRKEYEVIVMNERIDNLAQVLNDEISKVDKE
ncbi:MAG: hypothetical protein ABI462_07620 [Ignavibacteria bacterium]